jgi:hypothetical protein
MTKSIKFGVVEKPPQLKKEKTTQVEDSLLDYAINQGDWKLADSLLEKERIRNFELEAINKKINRLQTSINKVASYEVNNLIAEHIVKKKIKEEEDL